MKYMVHCTNPKGGGWLNAWGFKHAAPVRLYGVTVLYTCVHAMSATGFATQEDANECARQLVVTNKTIKLEAVVSEVES
jgi:hypothetical protein